jgi:hypothetical protein
MNLQEVVKRFGKDVGLMLINFSPFPWACYEKTNIILACIAFIFNLSSIFKLLIIIPGKRTEDCPQVMQPSLGCTVPRLNFEGKPHLYWKNGVAYFFVCLRIVEDIWRISFNRLSTKALISAHHHPIVVPEPVLRKRPSLFNYIVWLTKMRHMYRSFSHNKRNSSILEFHYRYTVLVVGTNNLLSFLSMISSLIESLLGPSSFLSPS